MADDPRTDKRPNDGTPGGAYPEPPDNSKPFEAPGGLGNKGGKTEPSQGETRPVPPTKQ